MYFSFQKYKVSYLPAMLLTIGGKADPNASYQAYCFIREPDYATAETKELLIYLYKPLFYLLFYNIYQKFRILYVINYPIVPTRIL